MCIYRGTGVLILKALAHICSGSVLSIGCRGVGGGGERERTMEFNDVTFDRCSSFLFFYLHAIIARVYILTSTIGGKSPD